MESLTVDTQTDTRPCHNHRHAHAPGFGNLKSLSHFLDIIDSVIEGALSCCKLVSLCGGGRSPITTHPCVSSIRLVRFNQGLKKRHHYCFNETETVKS